MKLKLTKSWRYGAVGAVVAALLGLSFLIVEPLGHRLKGLSYDLPFAFRKDIRIEEVVIISMDEESQRELSQSATNVWNRALHIEMLKQALALGARAVVFDVLFPDPWPDPAVDKRLADVIASASNRVVLSANLEDKEIRTDTNWTIITLLFTNTAPIQSAATWGVTRLPTDPDETLRRHFSHPTYRSLAWKTAELLGKVPGDPAGSRWINYYGPRGAIPRVSYYQVLQGTNALRSNFFSGKIVFVGRNPILTPKGTDESDEYRTSYTPWTRGQRSPGVEIQATAFLNLWRNEWLEELSPGSEFFLFLVLGILFGYGLVQARPLMAVGLAVIGSVVIAVAARLIWQRHLWFPWAIGCAVQIPAALAWSMIAHTFLLAREKKELETQLAARPPAPPPATPAATPAPAVDAGDTQRMPAIPDHTLLRCVGRGGYGQVWLARDILGNFRAVKIVYRKTFTNDEPFEREFRGIQSYSPISRSHPGWVHILHVGRNDAEGYFFYIMEAGDDERSGQKIDPIRYAPRTLAGELQRRGKLPLPECLPLSLALAEALGHLHQHSLVHRDIKPSNVIFVNGQPKFADIGLVTEFSEGREVSKVGTEGYNAPEGPGTPAADVYSLGKLIYEVSMGRDRRAFPEMPTAVFEQPAESEWHRLLEILLKACEPDPRQRYQRATELHADLLKFHRSVSAEEESP